MPDEIIATVGHPSAIPLPDRFRIDQEIGRGGMAVVYRAHDRHLDRFVAIKVLSEGLSGELGLERFQREIRLLAKLVHPGIVALFDSGETEGRLYYVMPFVVGDTLRARLGRERRLPAEDAAALAADVAEALAYAHGAGIVHRDVKPENIFSVGGRGVLADFGIARMVIRRPESEQELTTAGMVIGTMSYMSPEQATSEEHVDGRSDLYSLGCVLYELVTGTTPFQAPTPMALLAMHITESPRPPRDHNPALPTALNDLILQLLAKDPAQRAANAGQVVRALRGLQLSHTTASLPAPPTEADRLVEEGMTAYRFGTSGGPSAQSHLAQAEVYFKRAVATDPDHARALCGLGNWHYVMGNLGVLPREEAYATGRDYLLRALAADDRCAQVHCSMGKMALYYDDDCYAAARHAGRAVALDPTDSEILRFQSIVYKILGRTEDAVSSAREATIRNPEVPGLFNALGDALLAAGRNTEAIDALKRAVALQPGYAAALERQELACVRLGELDMAIELRGSRLRLGGGGERAVLLDRESKSLSPAEALLRDRRRELEDLLQQAERSDPFAAFFSTTTADRIVMAYAALGQWHPAMDWVERWYQRRPGRLRRALTDFPFDRQGLAVDPRYAKLLRVSGMEDLM